MEIKTAELCALCNLLIKYLEKRNISTISFSQDDSYYQKIWHGDRNLENNPEISLGFLDDDIQALRNALQEKIANPYDFERLGALLTIIGATLSRAYPEIKEVSDSFDFIG